MTGRGPRRILRAAALGTLALALTACAGLPTSGPVFAGLPPGAAAPPDFTFVPAKPQDGATPEQIVQGFIDAGIGPEGSWAVAHLYLAPTFRGQWKPGTTTTIDDRSTRTYAMSGDDKVVLTVTQQATVDSSGVYRPSDGGQTPLAFTLAKFDGQWRITHAPDGVVLGADQFTSVFHEYPLMYFDPGWQYLVPDVRWFPSSNAATRIAQALVDRKPSPWLAGSVVSAFPDNVALDLPSVPVSGSGAANVELSGPVLSLEPQTLDRMYTQLLRSLTSAGGVNDVSMAYAGTTLNTQQVATALTRVDPRALIGTAKGFGFVSGPGQTEPIPGISDALARLHPAAVQLGADYSAAAVRTAAGTVARITAKGDILPLDSRPGLIAPTIDPKGFVWSVPALAPGALQVFGPDGKRVGIGDTSWTNASRVGAIAISRDGTRIAALLTVGGQQVVQVVGVVRGQDGTPKSLGDAVQLAVLPGVGIDVAWLDDATLGIIARSGDGTVVIRQIVGGPSTSTPAPDDATMIAGTIKTTVRLRGADGTLYSQRGSNWEQAGTGVQLLAGTQGMPQD